MVGVSQRIQSANIEAVYHRNYRRARDRALTRLARAYPDEYKQYLQEEKLRDEKENKKWLDIAGNTSLNMVPDAKQLHSRREVKTDTNEGNDGGEE